MISLTLLRGAGSPEPALSLEGYPDSINEGQVLWVDAEDPTPQQLSELKERFSLDDYAIEDVLHRNQRPKVEDYKSCIFSVVHVPTVNQGKQEITELFVFFQKSWLITIHSGESETIRKVDARLRARGLGPLANTPEPDLLFYNFLDFAVDAYYPILDDIESQIETLDERGVTSFRAHSRKYQEVVRAMSEIGAVRKRLMGLRRSLGPTRDMVGNIMRGAVPYISDSSLRSFRDVYDHSFQLIETIDSFRDRTGDVRDLYISLLSASTDNIIKLLTIVATIFLPLSLLAGIYGTNFTAGFFEPGSGDPVGFYIFVSGLVILASAMGYLFRRYGWI